MSISSGRIAEFLSRAQNINDKAKVLETNKPSINPLRSTTISPIYTKKPELSPLSHQSFTSTHDGTPVPAPRKFILSCSITNKKSNSVPPKEKIPVKLPITKEKTELLSGRDSILSEFSQKRPEKVMNKESQIEKDHENAQKVKEIESKGKKKLQKVIEIFKQEALKTDQKLRQLQIENQKLKDIVDCPQLPAMRESVKTVKSVVEYLSSKGPESKFESLLESLTHSCKRTITHPNDYEKKIPNWFACLQIDPKDFPIFLSNICQKITAEQKRRLQTEEETYKMIEFEEALIRDLELKISKAETLSRSTSCGVIKDSNEFEETSLNRDQVSLNLLKLVNKKNSIESSLTN